MNVEEKKLDLNAKLSFMERVAYGLGDYSGNLVYSAISAFLLMYYTNVLAWRLPRRHPLWQFPRFLTVCRIW